MGCFKDYPVYRWAHMEKSIRPTVEITPQSVGSQLTTPPHHYTTHHTTPHHNTTDYTPHHNTTLHYTMQHFSTLHLNTTHYTKHNYIPHRNTTVHHNTEHYTTQRNTTLYHATTLRNATEHCTTLHYITPHYMATPPTSEGGPLIPIQPECKTPLQCTYSQGQSWQGLGPRLAPLPRSWLPHWRHTPCICRGSSGQRSGWLGRPRWRRSYRRVGRLSDEARRTPEGFRSGVRTAQAATRRERLSSLCCTRWCWPEGGWELYGDACMLAAGSPMRLKIRLWRPDFLL